MLHINASHNDICINAISYTSFGSSDYALKVSGNANRTVEIKQKLSVHEAGAAKTAVIHMEGDVHLKINDNMLETKLPANLANEKEKSHFLKSDGYGTIDLGNYSTPANFSLKSTYPKIYMTKLLDITQAKRTITTTGVDEKGDVSTINVVKDYIFKCSKTTAQSGFEGAWSFIPDQGNTKAGNEMQRKAGIVSGNQYVEYGTELAGQAIVTDSPISTGSTSFTVANVNGITVGMKALNASKTLIGVVKSVGANNTGQHGANHLITLESPTTFPVNSDVANGNPDDVIFSSKTSDVGFVLAKGNGSSTYTASLSVTDHVSITGVNAADIRNGTFTDAAWNKYGKGVGVFSNKQNKITKNNGTTNDPYVEPNLKIKLWNYNDTESGDDASNDGDANSTGVYFHGNLSVKLEVRIGDANNQSEPLKFSYDVKDLNNEGNAQIVPSVKIIGFTDENNLKSGHEDEPDADTYSQGNSLNVNNSETVNSEQGYLIRYQLESNNKQLVSCFPVYVKNQAATNLDTAESGIPKNTSAYLVNENVGNSPLSTYNLFKYHNLTGIDEFTTINGITDFKISAETKTDNGEQTQNNVSHMVKFPDNNAHPSAEWFDNQTFSDVKDQNDKPFSSDARPYTASILLQQYAGPAGSTVPLRWVTAQLNASLFFGTGTTLSTTKLCDAQALNVLRTVVQQAGQGGAAADTRPYIRFANQSTDASNRSAVNLTTKNPGVGRQQYFTSSDSGYYYEYTKSASFTYDRATQDGQNAKFSLALATDVSNKMKVYFTPTGSTKDRLTTTFDKEYTILNSAANESTGALTGTLLFQHSFSDFQELNLAEGSSISVTIKMKPNSNTTTAQSQVTFNFNVPSNQRLYHVSNTDTTAKSSTNIE